MAATRSSAAILAIVCGDSDRNGQRLWAGHVSCVLYRGHRGHEPRALIIRWLVHFQRCVLMLSKYLLRPPCQRQDGMDHFLNSAFIKQTRTRPCGQWPAANGRFHSSGKRTRACI